MILAEITADNKIQINEYENPIADGVLFETIKFTFPPSWDGYLKTAVFKTEEKNINILLSSANEMCLSDSQCYIPHEVLKGEQFELTVFGVKDDSIATAEKKVINILESGYALGESPSKPTQNEYQQLINLTKSALDTAQSVRDDANAGLFNGESGEKGDKGEKGEKGDVGPQGKDGKDAATDQTYNPQSENAQSGKAISEAVNQLNQEFLDILGKGYVNKDQFENAIKSIETALDKIITIQNTLIKVNLIYFQIKNEVYQAEKGMTWQQWCGSAYNTGLFICATNVYNDTKQEIKRENVKVIASDLIIEGENYELSGGEPT